MQNIVNQCSLDTRQQNNPMYSKPSKKAASKAKNGHEKLTQNMTMITSRVPKTKESKRKATASVLKLLQQINTAIYLCVIKQDISTQVT